MNFLEQISIFSANSFLGSFHVAFAFVVVITNGLAALWALMAHWLEKLRHKLLWWAIGVAYVFVGVQVILGVVQMVAESLDVDGFHMFYGFIALASIGIIYSYRQQIQDKKYLLFGLGGLFVMGLGIRAMVISAINTMA